MPVTNMLRKSNIRFYIGKLKTIVLTFSVPKSQNSNEERKILSHMKRILKKPLCG